MTRNEERVVWLIALGFCLFTLLGAFEMTGTFVVECVDNHKGMPSAMEVSVYTHRERGHVTERRLPLDCSVFTYSASGSD